MSIALQLERAHHCVREGDGNQRSHASNMSLITETTSAQEI